MSGGWRGTLALFIAERRRGRREGSAGGEEEEEEEEEEDSALRVFSIVLEKLAEIGKQ